MVRKSERKRSLDRPGSKWKGNFKICLKKQDGRIRIGLIWLEKWTTDRVL